MRLPRDTSGRDLARRLRRYGYRQTNQTGSHIRLTTQEGGEHHLTIPDHDGLRVGTLSDILLKVAGHFGTDKGQIAEELFG